MNRKLKFFKQSFRYLFLPGKGCQLIVVLLAFAASLLGVQGQSNDCPPQPLLLFNSGVDDHRVPLNMGSVDNHYSLTSRPDGISNNAVVTAVTPGWLPNTAQSQWIGPGTNEPGLFVYQISFFLACTNHAVVSGRWAVDNDGAIILDGSSTPVATLTGGSAVNFTTWHAFNINSGLSEGQNTLTFYVTNNGNATGLRVELGGSATCCCPASPLDLPNSGSDTNGAVLTSGAADPRFVLVSSPNGAGPQAFAVDPVYPGWLTNNSSSEWIGANADGSGFAGTYQYRVTFYVPCTNQAVINGQWAVDNSGTVILNENPSPVASITSGTSSSFSSLHPFSIGGGLVPGLNTLDFFVTNATDGATGLRVEMSGSAACCCFPTNYIILNTGYNHPAGTTYQNQDSDAFWKVVGDPDPNTINPWPATIISPNPAWAPAQSGSQWISRYATPDDNLNGAYDFQTQFCLETNYGNIELNFCLRADDWAEVRLNEQVILQAGDTAHSVFYRSPRLDPICTNLNSTVNPNLFTVGANYLKVRVYNAHGVAMGLNLTGSVSGNGLLEKPECCQPLSGISGLMYFDMNNNGVRDPGEPALPGWTVHLSTGAEVVTDSNGYYHFANLSPGIYTVTELPQANWTQTEPAAGSYTVVLGSSQEVNGRNFGNWHDEDPACVQILCPSDIVTECTGYGAEVPFVVMATNLCTTNTLVIHTTPRSGSLFPVGTTTVHCSAYDSVNFNYAICSFNVTVEDTTPPVITNVPPGGDLGCNPTNPPTDASIAAMIGVTDSCSDPVIIVSHVDNPSPCGMSRLFSIYASDSSSNNTGTINVNYTWIVDTNKPNIVSGTVGVCYPTVAEAESSALSATSASDNCGSISLTASTVVNACSAVITVTATDACGNSASVEYLTQIRSATSSPVFTSLPVGGGLGCNPSTLPTDSTIRSLVAGTNQCGLLSTNITHVDGNSGAPCQQTRTFTISLSGACGSITSTNITYSWIHDLIPPNMTCSPNKTVVCGMPLTFDAPFVNSICTLSNVSLAFTTITNGSCPLVVTRTWIATDQCGNSNSCSQSITVVASPCLIGWWPGDGNANNLAGGHVGSLNGGVGYIQGISGAAFNFTASGEWVEVPDGPALDITGGITMAAWVNPSAAGVSGAILNKATAGIPDGYYFDMYLGHLRLLVGYAGSPSLGVYFVSQQALPANQWTHVAATYDGSVINLYVNGALDSSRAFTDPFPGPNGRPVLIGNSSSGVEWFSGAIDEAVLYACALSSNQIASNYAGGRPKNPLLACSTNKIVNLSAGWSFDEPVVNSPCSSTNFTSTILSTITNGSCPVTITRTWLFTDACGNSESCSQMVTISPPTPQSWTTLPSMQAGRWNSAAVLLPSGRVLVAGGGVFPAPQYLPTVDIYDSAQNAWLNGVPALPQAHRNTAVRLLDGRVLVAGDDAGPINFTAYLYDEVNSPGAWLPAGTPNFAHVAATLTRLNSGKVLLAGGYCGGACSTFNTAEIYDPSANDWTPINPMAETRFAHTATLLPSGKVLIAGGAQRDPALIRNTCELYDESQGVGGNWSARAPMQRFRCNHTATLLPNGKVLVVGGTMGPTDFNNYTTSAEVYDPSMDTWTIVAPMSIPRAKHTATLLSCGKVLITGGMNDSGSVAACEAYDYQNDAWSVTTPMSVGRFSHTATLLPSRQVLIAGGWGVNGEGIASAELYTSDCCGGAAAPIVSCAGDKMILCGTNWTFDPPSVSGVCGDSNVLITVLSTVTNGVCPQVATRNWLVMDACGYTNICSQTVTMGVTGPQATPVILGIFRDAAGAHVIVQTLPCYNYAIECKANLLDPVWSTCQTFTGTGANYEFIDPPPLSAARFYRVRRLCP